MTPQSATATQVTTKETVPIKQLGPASIFDRIDGVHDSIARRAFEIFEGKSRWFGHDLDDWFRAESELLHPMHLELKESDTSLSIRAEVPGFSTKRNSPSKLPSPSPQ